MPDLAVHFVLHVDFTLVLGVISILVFLPPSRHHLRPLSQERHGWRLPVLIANDTKT